MARRVIGTALVIAGLLLLLTRFTDIELDRWGWPFFVIVPGLVLLGFGLSGREGAGEGATVAGTVVTTVGLLLLYQSVTDHWESWAYGWTLVAPGAVGAGRWLSGVRAGDPDRRRSGARIAVAGAILFLVGFAFFEGILGIGGRDLGAVGDVLAPLLVVVAGLWLLFRPRSRRSAADPET